jgi:hypothetical protein
MEVFPYSSSHLNTRMNTRIATQLTILLLLVFTELVAQGLGNGSFKPTGLQVSAGDANERRGFVEPVRKQFLYCDGFIILVNTFGDQPNFESCCVLELLFTHVSVYRRGGEKVPMAGIGTAIDRLIGRMALGKVSTVPVLVIARSLATARCSLLSCLTEKKRGSFY